jgi:hypothetical protein
MRTSGSGSRDVLMLTVPLSILVFFGIGAAGGITPFLRLIEGTLEAFGGWVMTLF